MKAWPGLLKERAAPEVESEERRGRDPKYTPIELLALQLKYHDYKKANPALKKEDVNKHLQDCGSHGDCSRQPDGSLL